MHTFSPFAPGEIKPYLKYISAKLFLSFGNSSNPESSLIQVQVC